MYKCICASVTESQINELLAKGLTRVEAYAILNVGENCGRCVLDDVENVNDKCDNERT